MKILGLVSLNMLTTHCVSLDLALELREAGYPQEGAVFYWSIVDPDKTKDDWQKAITKDVEPQLVYGNKNWGECFTNIAAPLASELLGELPKSIPHEWDKNDLAFLQIHFDHAAVYAGYNLGDGCLKPDISTKDLLETLAKLLIHLIKNNLCSPKK